MTKLGLIVRCDSGGLGNQTWEMYRHLHPDAVLEVRAEDAARGHEDVDRYVDCEFRHVMDRRGSSKVLRSFASRVDVVVTVECTYVHGGFDVIRDAGSTGVLVANPELYDPSQDGFADRTYVPTSWGNARHRLPLLHNPVATDRFSPTTRESCRVFYHPTAPAMLDRNGTAIVLHALQFVKQPCKVYVRGKPQEVKTSDAVELVWLPDSPRDYWDTYPPDADCLLLPRRYGGLCLPLLEAAALGMPAVMIDLPPQNELTGHVYGVKARGARSARMKGGTFPVYDVDPSRLADVIDGVVTDEAFAARSLDARLWAESQSWDILLPEWERVIEG